ncbi:DUF6220 domain-containing protein [Streptosporangium pseudovulgare]|uniref:Integral membrane protein n=1 Tax=Streptosporangium pseudovulgare TaxID=35765 RepID=A0ABQ2QHB3_9ACTN|nr:DUF6220 domain-containing protein [Streptosporangium pseudovulgare]GGP79926.1 hypothetical protein GCM10010140_05620 [Streptosporangium pseudovulgare]
MRKVYVALAGLLLAAVVVQFYFAAVGAFDRPMEEDSFALHNMVGRMVIPILSLLATVAAALARAPGRLIALTLLPLGLVVVQVLIVVLGRALNDDTGYTTTASLVVLGLHAVNGMAVVGSAGTILRQARALAAAPAGATSGGTAPEEPAARVP